MSGVELTFCRCGLAMYAVEAEDGAWVFVCEDCDGPEVRSGGAA